MAPRSLLFKILAALLVLQPLAAFVPFQQPSTTTKSLVEKMNQIATTAAIVVSTSPLVAIAEEVDDYEYGSVNAPIGLAWAGGVLAILTALLPIALQGGEEAFEEMKERDAGKFGTGDSSALNSRKRGKF